MLNSGNIVAALWVIETFLTYIFFGGVWMRRVSLHLLNENVNFSSSTSEKFHFSLQQYLRDTHDGTSCDSEVMRCGFSGFIVDVKPDKNSHLQRRQTPPSYTNLLLWVQIFHFNSFVRPSATSSDAYTENSKKNATETLQI